MQNLMGEMTLFVHVRLPKEETNVQYIKNKALTFKKAHYRRFFFWLLFWLLFLVSVPARHFN